MGKNRILVVVSSHASLGESGKKTGYWLGEVTHFIHYLEEAGYQVDYVSPKGGEAPVDPKSMDLKDKFNLAFWEDDEKRSQLENTLSPEQIDPADYCVVYYAGGHGAMWDFRENEKLNQIAIQVYNRGGVVSSVCHGTAGLLDIKTDEGKFLIEGRQVSGFRNLEEKAIGLTKLVPYALETEIKNRGAVYSKCVPFVSHSVEDERIVTGQNPQSAKAVGKDVVKCLKVAGISPHN